jgi:lipopolysaccharide/colanic/teichoic acid biosynthesis glycosyltransferase
MVKPGLTGSVAGQRAFQPRLGGSVIHDLDYVDNWRPGLDLGIVFRTVGAVSDATALTEPR